MSDYSPTAIVTPRSDVTMLERLALVGFPGGLLGSNSRLVAHRPPPVQRLALAERQMRLLEVHRTHPEL
jgi:hypothetical protein